MASLQTTIKTEQDSFSEYRTYPGRGTRYVAKDGKSFFFQCNKSRAKHLLKRKPQKIRWTTAWRRAHKKLHTTDLNMRKRKRRQQKVQKAIVGLSLDDLKKHRKPVAPKGDAKSAALQEAKARKSRRK
ncbi:MAG: uncharacterized protein KVP18_005022 [Porospora cf. gigantea A]|uniref:uncharacterized protein n=1 Tax=Porospora cf. gigantea A TaxID=2853593 RepID=UPI00355A1AC0|nr:MAG: hypothetical protein KVP18_005022 [Porospora cf. gigantea A]